MNVSLPSIRFPHRISHCAAWWGDGKGSSREVGLAVGVETSCGFRVNAVPVVSGCNSHHHHHRDVHGSAGAKRPCIRVEIRVTSL